MKKVAGCRNLYKDKDGFFWARTQKGGGNSWVALGTTRKEEAIDLQQKLAVKKLKKAHGIEDEPEKPSPLIGPLLDEYRKADYPDMRMQPRDRQSTYFRDQEDYYAMLRQFFATHHVSELRPALLIAYKEWRTDKQRLRCESDGGLRIVDLELTCLSNCLNWAANLDKIPVNPIKSRTKFVSSKNVTHCKERAPLNVDDLHTVTAPLFAGYNRRGEAIAFQAIWEALSGCRSKEAVELRIDAKPGEPGYVEGDHVWVRRCKKSDVENPLVYCHEGIKQFLKAHREWLKKRFPKSKWWFPNYRREGEDHVTKTALTTALRKLFENKKLDRRFSSHGMRALYVRIRRSQGIPDSQIALELNQNGGVATLVKCYGACPPEWISDPTKRPNYSWTPEVAPAWTKIKPFEKENESAGEQSPA